MSFLIQSGISKREDALYIYGAVPAGGRWGELGFPALFGVTLPEVWCLVLTMGTGLVTNSEGLGTDLVLRDGNTRNWKSGEAEYKAVVSQ